MLGREEQWLGMDEVAAAGKGAVAVRASPPHPSSCKTAAAVCSEGDPMGEEWRRYTSETLLG